MANITSKIKSLLALVFWGLVAVMFVFGLRQFVSQSVTATSQTQESYPGPESAITNPYPAPFNIPQPASTSESLVWLMYSGDNISYSFNYRSDFLISATSISGKPFGTARIVFPRIGAMDIEILENPNQLPLEQFIETNLADVGITPSSWPTGGVQNYSDALVIAGQPALAFESHRDLIPWFGAAGHIIFVSYDQFIVKAMLDGGGPVPDDGAKPYNASNEAIEIAVQVLYSLQFHEQ